jgi:hypothetical protein
MGKNINEEQEQCTIHGVGRSVFNLEIAIKHFEQREKDFNGKVTTDEVIRVLHFLKQCEMEDNKLVAIAYKRYDGKEYKDTPLNKMYECGYAVL